jgi:uncharacterized protein YggE
LSPLGPQTAAHNFLPSFSFEMMVIDSEFDLSEEIIMSATSFVVHRLERLVVLIGVLLLAAALFAIIQAQAQESKSPAEGRVIVIGEGSIGVPPDYAQIRTGVTTTAKTVKEANDANIKVMTAITAALLDSGIPQKNIQTSRFSIQPVFTPQTPPAEPKFSGYRVSNQVNVAVHQISRVGEILDHLVNAGATDIGNIEFLVSDPSKALDQAREAAVADARRKAELYARASGVSLGRVAWITESSEFEPPLQLTAPRASLAKTAPVPIEQGEDTLRTRVTVGFDIAR